MKILIGILFFLFIGIQISSTFFNWSLFFSRQDPIKVGLVYSMNNHLSNNEKQFEQATLMAIEEINLEGGLLGRKIQPIIRNVSSSWEKTEKAVADLILNEHVCVIFGCWSMESHYKTKKLFEKHEMLLISPYQYEGIIASPSIINIGISANQQAIPAVYYSQKYFGNRFFLIGSQYMYSHLVNQMIEDHIVASGGEIVGIDYLPLEDQENAIDEIVKRILDSKPDAILSSVLSSDNQLFFKKIRQAGILAKKTPIFSLTLSESLLKYLDPEDTVGQYSVWNYFQSIDSDLNREFIDRFKKYSGIDVVDNTAEASYLGVKLWTEAVKQTQSTQAQSISYNLINMRLMAPEGFVTMDADGKAAWKYSRVGKVNSNNQFEIVWQSPRLIRPIPIQIFRSKLEWDELIEKTYQKLNPPYSIDSQDEKRIHHE